MQKLRFIEIPNHSKGNGLRYGEAALKFVNDLRLDQHELSMQVWKEYGHDVTGAKANQVSTLSEVWDSPKCRATMLLVNKVPAAFVMTKRSGTYVAFWNFIVAQPFRHHGYGRMLMQHSIDRHRKLGFTEMSLNVLAANTRALDMYYESGFKPINMTMSLKLQG